MAPSPGGRAAPGSSSPGGFAADHQLPSAQGACAAAPGGDRRSLAASGRFCQEPGAPPPAWASRGCRASVSSAAGSSAPERQPCPPWVDTAPGSAPEAQATPGAAGIAPAQPAGWAAPGCAAPQGSAPHQCPSPGAGPRAAAPGSAQQALAAPGLCPDPRGAPCPAGAPASAVTAPGARPCGNGERGTAPGDARTPPRGDSACPSWRLTQQRPAAAGAQGCGTHLNLHACFNRL